MRGDALLVNLHSPLATGDGIVISGDRFADKEVGGRVYELFQDGQKVPRVDRGRAFIGLQRGVLIGKQFPEGTTLFKTDDPQLTKRLRRTYESADPQRRVPVDVDFFATVGQPLRLVARVPAVSKPDHPTALPIAVEVLSQFVPEVARRHPISSETLAEQFGRLGGSVYRLRTLHAQIEENRWYPIACWAKCGER
ncbi:MAG: DUF3656 domain-containing protein [Pirellulaceae bacterium]